MRVNSTKRNSITPAWVVGDGPSGDVAISTRARMARNVQGFTFPSRASKDELRYVADLVLDSVYAAKGKGESLRVIHSSHLAEQEKLELVNARLASRQQVDGGRYRPIVLDEQAAFSLMINEEDHLRIQCIFPGLQLIPALNLARKFDSLISSKITYAQADNYGYLTSSLANIGTGLRLSVMLHLPALSFSGAALEVLMAAAQLKIYVRGLLGEGSKALGDIFQVSNETAIGFTENEIASRVRATAEHLINRERDNRHKLISKKRDDLLYAIENARKSVMSASSLTGRNAMEYISTLKLGGELELCKKIPAQVFSELLVNMRLGDSATDKQTYGSGERLSDDTRRARLVREKLTAEAVL